MQNFHPVYLLFSEDGHRRNVGLTKDLKARLEKSTAARSRTP